MVIFSVLANIDCAKYTEKYQSVPVCCESGEIFDLGKIWRYVNGMMKTDWQNDGKMKKIGRRREREGLASPGLGEMIQFR